MLSGKGHVIYLRFMWRGVQGAAMEVVRVLVGRAAPRPGVGGPQEEGQLAASLAAAEQSRATNQALLIQVPHLFALVSIA